MPSWLKKLFARPKQSPSQAGNTSFFRLTTSQGQTLVFPKNQATPHCTTTPDATNILLALIPESRPELCFLVNPDARAIAIPGDALQSIALSARILRTNQRGTVRLQQPLGTPRFLTADNDSQTLRFDGNGLTMEAAFTLLPAPPFEIPAAVKSLATQIAQIAATGLRQAPLLALLRHHPSLAETALRLLPRDELDDLARAALDDPKTLALLKTLLPHDIFVKTHLPNLAAWRTARTPSQTPLACTTADEALLLAPTNEASPPFGTALHTLARGHIAPRKNVCILAAARNEGPYLLDWIAYHRAIGFEHIFLYTNDNTDGSDTLLAALARENIITWIHNTRGEKIGVQEKAYAHALTLLPDILDYRWTAVIDIDEYFCFDSKMFDTVADFVALHETQPVDAIALCWLLLAAEFADAYSEAPTTQRFTWRAKDVNTHVKSIFRTRKFWHSQPHFPWPTLQGPFIYRNQNGGFHHHPGVANRIPAYSEHPAAEQGWINHYILRTAPETLWKLARGSAAWLIGEDDGARPAFAEWATRTFLDLTQHANRLPERRIEAFAKPQAAMRETLLSLPGVAAADAAIKRDFASALKTLSERYLDSPSPPDAPPSERGFRDAVTASLGRPRRPASATPALITQPRSRMV